MNITICPMVEPDVWEPPYLLESFKYLSDLSNDYHFIIARTNNYDELNEFRKSLKTDKKNILFLLSDELGIKDMPNGPYSMQNELSMIFRTYNNRSLYDENFVFPIPCGFSCGVGIHSENGQKSIFRKFDSNTKHLTERKYDFFFSGQLNPHRIECVNQLNTFSSKFNSIINTTKSFAKGYSLEEYYSILEETKISIVPTGVCVPESFRYFEASKSNCIIITTYPIDDFNYKNWYFEESPAIFLNSWSQLTENLIIDLLNQKNLNKYDILNREYYEKKISPESLSKYIRKKINEKF
jgi:hypothetical protein